MLEPVPRRMLITSVRTILECAEGYIVEVRMALEVILSLYCIRRVLLFMHTSFNRMCWHSRPYARCNRGVHLYYHSCFLRLFICTCHDTVHTGLYYLLGTLPSGWVEYCFCIFIFFYIFFLVFLSFSLLFPQLQGVLQVHFLLFYYFWSTYFSFPFSLHFLKAVFSSCFLFLRVRIAGGSQG